MGANDKEEDEEGAQVLRGYMMAVWRFSRRPITPPLPLCANRGVVPPEYAVFSSG